MGCDRVLGSEKALDVCGVCDGDNSSCENVIIKFQRKLRRGQSSHRLNWVIRSRRWSFRQSRIVGQAASDGTSLISLKGEKWARVAASCWSNPPQGTETSRLCFPFESSQLATIFNDLNAVKINSLLVSCVCNKRVTSSYDGGIVRLVPVKYCLFEVWTRCPVSISKTGNLQQENSHVMRISESCCLIIIKFI